MNATVGQNDGEEDQEPLLGLKEDKEADFDNHSNDHKLPQEPKSKLSIFDTALALVAATIGGEIIAIPYACYHLGLYLSIGLLILVAALSHISNMMYLKIKDLTPCHLESIYEIAYLLLGRPAIYIVCIVQYLLNFSSIVLYYVIIGDTMGSIAAHFFINLDASMTQKEVMA